MDEKFIETVKRVQLTGCADKKFIDISQNSKEFFEELTAEEAHQIASEKMLAKSDVDWRALMRLIREKAHLGRTYVHINLATIMATVEKYKDKLISLGYEVEKLGNLETGESYEIRW